MPFVQRVSTVLLQLVLSRQFYTQHILLVAVLVSFPVKIVLKYWRLIHLEFIIGLKVQYFFYAD